MKRAPAAVRAPGPRLLAGWCSSSSCQPPVVFSCALRSGPNLDRAFGQPAGSTLDFFGGPPRDRGKILDQLKAVARHPQQLFLALGHPESRRPPGGYEVEVPQGPDGFPVLVLGAPELGEPLRARQEGR